MSRWRAAWVGAGLLFSLRISQSASLYNYTIFNVPGFSSTWPSGINDRGEVVGLAGGHTAFLRSSDGTSYTFFTIPSGLPTANPYLGINDSRQMAGTGDTGTGPCANQSCGFLRDPSGALTYFAPLSTGGSIVFGGGAINNAGQVVGCYTDPPYSSGFHGFLRNPDGSYITINVPGAAITVALGISNNGEVVGDYTKAGEQGSHAFIRSADGSTYTTFDIPESLYTQALDINTRGEVLLSTSDLGAFVRNPDGSLVPMPGYADAINDLGQVVGTIAAGYQGYIATPIESPVPEPGTKLLLCTGALGPCVYRRRLTRDEAKRTPQK